MAFTIYHGACASCYSQEKYGTNRCNGCQYQRPNWRLPDLSISQSELMNAPQIRTFEDLIEALPQLPKSELPNQEQLKQLIELGYKFGLEYPAEYLEHILDRI